MDSKQVKVFHPTFEDISAQVDPSRVDEWVEQGWRKTPLKNGDVVAGIAEEAPPSKS